MNIKTEVNQYVNNFKTKYDMGFISAESEIVLEHFKSKYKFDMDKYYEAMYGNTCMVIDEQIVTYHCDIALGIMCGIEERKLTAPEWD